MTGAGEVFVKCAEKAGHNAAGSSEHGEIGA